MHPKQLKELDISFFSNLFIFKDYPQYFLVRSYYHDEQQILPLLMHEHSFYEINIVTSGNGWHYIENQCIEAKLGSVYVIPPNIKHGYYTEDVKSFKVFHILLSSKFMEKYKEELESIEGYKTMFEIEPILRSNLQNSFFLLLSNDELEVFKTDFDELAEFSQNKTYTNNIATIGKTIYLISKFCTLLLKQHGSIIKDHKPSNVNIDILNIIKSMEYIQNNFSEKITIDYLANMCQMSRSIFIKQFETYTKTTVNEYITRTRIEKSINLLLNSTHSISYISQECGFFDSSHFSKIFQKEKGISPLEFRKNKS